MNHIEEDDAAWQHFEDDFVVLFVERKAIDTAFGEQISLREKASGYSMIRLILGFKFATNLAAYFGESCAM